MSVVAPTESVTAAKLNLYQKLAKISGELGKIKKDGRAPEVMGGFEFISHGALMGHLRQRLSEENVLIVDSIRLLGDEVVTLRSKTGEREVRRVVIAMVADFVNADDPNEAFKVEWVGEGMDSTDKAIQKAATSAEKYLLFKVFKVSDQDDPDGAGATEDGLSPVVAPGATNRAAEGNYPSCPNCSGPLRRKTGTSKKTGKPYDMVACSTRDCNYILPEVERKRYDAMPAAARPLPESGDDTPPPSDSEFPWQ